MRLIAVIDGDESHRQGEACPCPVGELFAQPALEVPRGDSDHDGVGGEDREGVGDGEQGIRVTDDTGASDSGGGQLADRMSGTALGIALCGLRIHDRPPEEPVERRRDDQGLHAAAGSDRLDEGGYIRHTDPVIGNDQDPAGREGGGEATIIACSFRAP